MPREEREYRLVCPVEASSTLVGIACPPRSKSLRSSSFMWKAPIVLRCLCFRQVFLRSIRVVLRPHHSNLNSAIRQTTDAYYYEHTSRIQVA
jgi:hypothetical protein